MQTTPTKVLGQICLLFIAINTPLVAGELTGAKPEIKSCERVSECESAILYGNVDTKTNAVKSLSSMGRDAVPVLIKAMQDKDETVKVTTILALGVMGPEAVAATPALAQLLSDSSVNQRVATTLIRIGKSAIPYMIDILAETALTKTTDSKHSIERNKAIEVLAGMGETAVPALIEVLQSDKQDVGQTSAATALGMMGAKAKNSVPALIASIQNSNRYLKEKTINPGAQYIPIHDALLKMFKEDDVKYGVEALGNIGPDAKAAVPVLVQVYKSIDFSDNTEIKRHIIVALAEIQAMPEISVPLLIEGLKSTDDNTKIKTINALKNFGSAAKESVADLKLIVKYSSNAQINNAAMAALSAIDAIKDN